MATTYERLDYGSPDGCQIGDSAAKVAFYGGTPVVRRTYVASRMDTTAIASSTDFAAGQLAALHEVMNTLTGLAIWPAA